MSTGNPRTETPPGVFSSADLALSAFVGLVTLVTVWFVWGQVRPLPAVHDEWAYVLQCEIFATGRWSAPSPPVPEFFEQFWVFVEPVVASKYWPGHSLLMTPGCVLGMPHLVPLLLSALTGGLMFWLVARLSSRGVALLAWVLWCTSLPNLHFRASYFANVSTGALWVVALALAWCWQRNRRAQYLILMFAVLAWAVITRPMTGVVLSVPLVIWVLWSLRHDMSSLIMPVGAAGLVLLVIPLWGWMTLGSPLKTPYTEYARLYFPFDRIGFTFNDETPARQAPPEMVRYGRRLAGYFKSHTLTRLPETAIERLEALATQSFSGWRLVLVPLLALGAITAARRREAWLILPTASASMLFLAHLTFAHPPEWTHYYFEAFPVAWVLVAVGGGAAMQWYRSPGIVRATLIAILLSLTASDMLSAKVRSFAWHYRVRTAMDRIETTTERAVIFVQPETRWVSPFGLIQNSPDLQRESRWVVRDLGSDNYRLLQHADGRRPYVLSLDTLQIKALD
jgi:hypothetical protein